MTKRSKITLPIAIARTPTHYSDPSLVRAVQHLHERRSGVDMHGIVAIDSTIANIGAEEFHRQILWLKDNFDIVPLDAIVEYAAGDRKLSRPSVALTFDDGYADLFYDVVPLLQKYRLPATLFAVADSKRVHRGELGNDKQLLTVDQLRLLQHLGWTIEAHTSTHPNLSSLSLEEQRAEIIESKQALEQMLGATVNYFAYPKGMHDPSLISLCREAGYRAAFTTVPVSVKAGQPLFQLPRVSIDRTHNSSRFRALFTRLGRTYLRTKQTLVGIQV